MQIIIVGAGKIGSAVAAQLAREGHDIAIIEENGATLENVLESVDVAAICGTGADSRILKEAKVERCDLLIALTESDEENLIICLLGKKLGAKNTIARVRSPEYSEAVPVIAEDLGLSMAINPEREAAMEIARILELPFAKKVETFSRGKVEMLDFDIDAESPMCGKLVKNVFANIRSALVCAVERGGEVSIPLGDFRFEEGDVITVIAPTGRMSEFFRDAGLHKTGVKRVLISGGGRSGFYLAQRLLSQRVRVTIIEQNEATARSLAEALPSADVRVGDGTSLSVLEEAGLGAADAFCCLTGIDEENILTSLHARRAIPSIKTVTKINRVELVSIVSPIGLGSVVSPKLIAADRVISYVRSRQNGQGSGVLTMNRIGEDKAEAIEFEVGESSRLIGVPIAELKLKKNVIIACINRKGHIVSPRGSDVLQLGDTVIVVTTHSGFDVLNDVLADGDR